MYLIKNDLSNAWNRRSARRPPSDPRGGRRRQVRRGVPAAWPRIKKPRSCAGVRASPERSGSPARCASSRSESSALALAFGLFRFVAGTHFALRALRGIGQRPVTDRRHPLRARRVARKKCRGPRPRSAGDRARVSSLDRERDAHEAIPGRPRRARHGAQSPGSLPGRAEILVGRRGRQRHRSVRPAARPHRVRDPDRRESSDSRKPSVCSRTCAPRVPSISRRCRKSPRSPTVDSV